jgi:hypothetical protein
MTFTFNNAIPAAANNPSSDQPGMLTNNISNALIWAVDHFGFNSSNGGSHQCVRMPFISPGVIPSGLIANEVTVYPKTASGNSNLFLTNGNSGDEYQMTNVNHTFFPQFGTYAAYGTAAPSGFTKLGGWTFLAGNGGNVSTPIAASGSLMFQYGSFYRTSFNSGSFVAGRTGTIDFPRPFLTDCFIVVATPLYNDLSAPPASGGIGNISIDYNAAQPTTTNFTYLFTTVSGGYIGFTWYAIGV